MEHKTKLLIIAADDFGLTPGVNRGILQAHSHGVVTSASLMVHCTAFDDAVDLARNNPSLDIGLHLDLTNNPLRYAIAVFQRKIGVNELERAIRSQIEKALATGLRISHIDGHKHVHVIPQVLKIVSRVAPEYGIRPIRPLLTTTPRLISLFKRNPSSRAAILNQYLLGKAATAAWRLSADPNVLGPSRFYGVAETGFLDLTTFGHIIGSLAPGVNEVMCHPGYNDDDLSKLPTRLRVQRQRELQLLTSRELRRLLDNAGVKLISYRDIHESDSIFNRCSAV